MSSILFIGAHPDDVELGCLGTILSLIDIKTDCSVLILSDGEAGGNRRIRKNEIITIQNKVKYTNLFFGHLLDTKIMHNKNTINIIEHVIQKCHAEIIFTHSFKDSHQDHINTSLSTISATRQQKNLIFYPTPSTLPTFAPNLYIDISKHINKKLRIIDLFKSQIQKKSVNVDAIKAGTRYYGYLNQTKHCEPFEIFKLNINIDETMRL